MNTDNQAGVWVDCNDRLPAKANDKGIGRNSSGAILSAFYARTGEYSAEGFDDNYDYIDENNFLIEGWYTIYEHFGVCFIVPIKDISEWLDESPHPSAEAVSEQPEGYIGDRIKKEMDGYYTFNHPARKIFDEVCWRLYGMTPDTLFENRANNTSGFWLDIILPAMEQYAKATHPSLDAGKHSTDEGGGLADAVMKVFKGSTDRPLSHAGQRLVDKQLDESVGVYHQPLFNLMVNDHGLTLLNSEMDEIIRVVIKMIEPSSESLEEKATEAAKEVGILYGGSLMAFKHGFLAGANYILKQQKGE